MAALRRKDYEMVAFDPNLKPGEPFQGLADYLRNSREDLAGMLDLLPVAAASFGGRGAGRL